MNGIFAAVAAATTTLAAASADVVAPVVIVDGPAPIIEQSAALSGGTLPLPFMVSFPTSRFAAAAVMAAQANQILGDQPSAIFPPDRLL